MRAEARKSGFSVHAISGTRAVLLAMNCRETALERFAGFAIGTRQSVQPGEIRWLRGFKFFEDVVPDPHPGERRSTFKHPVQTFLWGHYTADPDREFHYTIRPMFFPPNGNPANLVPGNDLNVSIRTEAEDSGKHSILFNRGAIVSQAFADRFGDLELDQAARTAQLSDPDNEQTKWLSRGLLEGALAFIGQAKDHRFSLRCNFYELTYTPILDALAKAAQNGADVQICYEAGHRAARNDQLAASDQGKRNKAVIAPFVGRERLRFHDRTRHIAIPHNKFIILMDRDRPIEVWTGSTNITASGFLGQSNVGHIIRDEQIARKYLEFWQMIADDTLRAPLKTFNMQHTPRPVGQLPQNSVSAFFSPRKGDNMLAWYGSKVDEAEQTVLLTSAFGVTRQLAEHFNNDRDYLRFILMEKPPRSAETAALLTRDRDTRIVMGEALGTKGHRRSIEGWALDEWFRREEHFRTRGHIFYVHTKYMCIDPLTDDPKVFSGSANFSPGSLSSNDENMLLIRGDTHVADVYLTEFFRLFNHFFFRNVANRNATRRRGGASRAIHLGASDGWTSGYFRAENYRAKRRELFGISP